MQANYANLAQLLLHTIERVPYSIAIKDQKRYLTYTELYDHSRQVSQVLLKNGMHAGDRIVVISWKNVESVVAFWGIILFGGIPVMLDQDDGLKDNELKIKGVSAGAIILDRREPLPGLFAGDQVIIDFKELEAAYPVKGEPIINPTGLADTCYILLTSGTTGKPKAVQITNGNVLHYTRSIYEKIGSPAMVNAVHASTFAADLGLTNLLVALVSGGMLRILDKAESTDPAIFHQIIRYDAISLLKITPSHLLALLSNMGSGDQRPIENIILGGEKLTWETIRTVFSRGICTNLYNHYGPTETTIGAIAFRIEMSYDYFGKTGSAPLGMPIGQGACFLENPVDGIGELYITGPGVSAGYFENETENSKKFFSRSIDGLDVVCYRTGDICRKLADGNYEFLYRTDRQVKVKGYRIELGEIELLISSHPDIEVAIVCLSGNEDYKTMEAYIKLAENKQLGKEALRTWLSERTTGYKIPSAFYFFKKAPYNSNGKIDIKALTESLKNDLRDKESFPEKNASSAGLSWPQLAQLTWMNVLNKAEISGSDDFFEIGGDSLLAIQLIGRCQRHGYKIHVADLNKNSLFRNFIALCPELSSDNSNRRERETTSDWLTFSQRCFLRQNQFDLNSYCQTILLETKNKLRIREMAVAIDCVLQSHLQLTKKFRKNTSSDKAANNYREWKVGTTVIDNKTPVNVQIRDTCGSMLDKISLEKGILFMAHIFIDQENKDYILLVCHHLVIDVISWNILIDELFDYYSLLLENKYPVIAAENTVYDFFRVATRKPSDQKWRPDTNGLDTIYRLPANDVDKDLVGVAGVYQLALPLEISAILGNLQDAGQLSLSGFLLSAFGNALLKEFSVRELTVDLEFHGRSRQQDLPDLSRSVAWWATTWPVNLKRGTSDPYSCTKLIEEKAAFANMINVQDGEALHVMSDRADVRFNYLGRFPESFGNDDVRVWPSHLNPGLTRSALAETEYKLFFTVRFIGSALIIDIQYNVRLFSKSNMENITRNFFCLLKESLKKESFDAGAGELSVLESNMPSVGQPLYNLYPGSRGLKPAKKVIFLTGATGFLGAHLIATLTGSGDVELYCLVRGESQKHAEHRIENSLHYYFQEFSREQRNRIHIVRGDLLTDRLGIEQQLYQQIGMESDLIIHAAADINLLKNYQELTATNILPLQNIFQLANTGKVKPVHFISTLSISGYSPDSMYRDFSEENFDDGQVFASAYEKTKFEAERIMRSFLKNGGTGRIYRVGHIAADSAEGKFQQNIGQNRIFQILRGILLLNKVPAIYDESLSFSHVDIVAKGIARFCLDIAGDEMPCLHMENPHYLSFGDIIEWLQQIGYDIDVVETSLFKKAVADFRGTEKDINDVYLMDNWIQRAVDFPRRINYIHRKSLDIVARTGLYFPKTGPEWFACMVDQAVKAGYFHAPSDKPFDEAGLASAHREISIHST